MIQADTEVSSEKNNIKSSSLDKLKIKGLGGTFLQPAFDLVSKKYNMFNSVLLTDGYLFEKIDLTNVKGKLLVISTGKEIEYCNNRSKVKQIIIDQ